MKGGRRAVGADTKAGLLFIVIGLAFGAGAIATLQVGSASRMGPGYFPLFLSGVLILIGIAVSLQASGRAAAGAAIPWRGVALLTLAPILFGALIDGLGLIATVIIVTMTSAYASRKASFLTSLLLGVVLAAVSVALFTVALGLRIPLAGPWLLLRGRDGAP